MSKHHKSIHNSVTTFGNNEGHRELLCRHEAVRVPSQKLSKETLVALEELGVVIKSIRTRMYNEGYNIVNGVVQKRDHKCI